MLKKATDALIMMAFACFVFGYGFLVWEASNNTPTHQQPHQASYRRARDNQATPQPAPPFLSIQIDKIAEYCASEPSSEPDKWLHNKFLCDMKATDVVVAFSTILLMFITGALAVFTYMLWGSAERTARRQLRAYLIVNAQPIGKPVTPNEFVKITLEVTNLGATPFYDFTMNGGVNLASHPFPRLRVPTRRQIERSDGKKTGVFGKSIYITKEAVRKFPDDQIKLAVNGELIRLYVHGVIYYRDIFRTSHWTKFCLMYYGDSMGTMSPEYCDTDNTAS